VSADLERECAFTNRVEARRVRIDDDRYAYKRDDSQKSKFRTEITHPRQKDQ